MEPPRTHTIRHDSHLGAWELVRRPAHAALTPYVRELEGYTETRMDAPARLEVPFPSVVMILNFAKPYTISGPGNLEPRAQYGSFVAGLTDAHVVVDNGDLSHCLQVNLTPIGAHLVLGMPMSEIANRALSLDDVLGPSINPLLAQLEDTPDWDARFAVVESMIARRISEARPPSRAVVRAWQRLNATDGRVPVQTLADEAGWSRKHLVAQFREQVGLPPKTVARILRFHGALERISATHSAGWAELAYSSGYYDQAHFNREFREFAGVTPGEYLARMIPDGGVRP